MALAVGSVLALVRNQEKIADVPETKVVPVKGVTGKKK